MVKAREWKSFNSFIPIAMGNFDTFRPFSWKEKHAHEPLYFQYDIGKKWLFGQ